MEKLLSEKWRAEDPSERKEDRAGRLRALGLPLTISLLLHGGLLWLMIYGMLSSPGPELPAPNPVRTVQLRFVSIGPPTETVPEPAQIPDEPTVYAVAEDAHPPASPRSGSESVSDARNVQDPQADESFIPRQADVPQVLVQPTRGDLLRALDATGAHRLSGGQKCTASQRHNPMLECDTGEPEGFEPVNPFAAAFAQQSGPPARSPGTPATADQVMADMMQLKNPTLRMIRSVLGQQSVNLRN